MLNLGYSIWSVPLAVLILVSACDARAETFCTDKTLDRQVSQAAQDQLSMPQLLALTRRLNAGDRVAFSCSPRVVHCVSEKYALDVVDHASGLLPPATPSDIAGAREELENARAFGAPWQLLVTLGDIKAAVARKDHTPDLYRDAAKDLQLALNEINEKPVNAPPKCGDFGEIVATKTEIQRIRKRAEEAVLLASTFEIARTKAGDCGGIFLASVKGVDVESIPLPITFAYKRADLTDEGRKAADALLVCVREKKIPTVILTGHTDSHGSDGYNLDLSARRLKTVGDLLKNGGYAGTLQLIPKGKREAFQSDDPSQHTAEELDQMNRRVELRRTEP